MRIDFDVDAFKEIRYSAEAAALVEAEAQKIADRANAAGKGTYAVGSQAGQAKPSGRHRASVVTADHAAIRDNAKHNTLLKALGQS